MVEGTVKFFNSMKHFGFIAGDDGKEYFVHASGLKEGVSIKEGDKVSFDVVQGDRGPKAEGVEKIDSEEMKKAA
ncbi:cold-shock protein [Candidatus Woesearchaeota archaeon]|nr:cold-shock protein [Candidatus Woesearchaeota archaeon]